MISASIEITAPFFDVDSCHIVWHGHYVKYFELARCCLLDKIGYNYKHMAESGYTFPVVDLQVKYVQSVKFMQTIVVQARLQAWENKLIIHYTIKDQSSGRTCTKGSTTQVAVALESGLLQFETPAALRDKVQRCLNAGTET
ncbi:MAG: acyl-CoA thioesterase [Cellvibrionaceae bacterium]|nr:acyl-CoA thioesterase [Cellvibrionaceae bacterium]